MKKENNLSLPSLRSSRPGNLNLKNKTPRTVYAVNPEEFYET